ncbi:MAG: hypothetical protein WC379_08520 [Methanoregula sp.]
MSVFETVPPLRDRVKRRLLVAVFVCIVVLILAPLAAAVVAGPDSNPDLPYNSSRQTAAGQVHASTLPAIAPNNSPGFFTRQYSFPFQQENITLNTNVSAAVYYGAQTGDKFATAPFNATPEALAPDYYRAFVNDPAQEMLYADLTRSFRIIRQEHGYTDDEYAELLSVFVQSLPYDNLSATHPDTLSRFPAETLVDGTGDCDDKSVLLAGLLSREGYNVSLLLFIPEHHMAVGLVSDCLRYNDTGYLYIETTGVSFMGDVPKRLNQSEKYVADGQTPGSTPLTSAPLVIRVGSGSGTFTRAGETGYILARKNEIDARIASLKEQINTTSPENPSRLRMLLETYNAYAEVHNYIGKHRHDRAGTYRYLISAILPACPEPQVCVGQSGTPAAPGDSPGTPVGGPPGRAITPFSLTGCPAAAGYLPCPRGIWVSRQCLWQNLRQGLVGSSR